MTGLLLQTGSEELEGNVLNVGSQEETRIIDLAEKIVELSSLGPGVKFLPFPPGDHGRCLPEIGKASKAIL